ncbi:MAG: hypothetical protein ACFFD4_31895 [Candidatus Odinarchaeota archaeon]
MTCSIHQKAFRFLSRDGIICPICENKYPLPEMEANKYTENLEKELQSSEQIIKKRINGLHLPETTEWLLYERENCCWSDVERT